MPFLKTLPWSNALRVVGDTSVSFGRMPVMDGEALVAFLARLVASGAESDSFQQTDDV